MVLSRSSIESLCNVSTISTLDAVLSPTFLIRILPLSLAAGILSIRLVVVVPKRDLPDDGVLRSFFSMRARMRIRPPRKPSLYFEKSAMPPVGKSGRMLTFLPCKRSIDASSNSTKLCGRMRQARPTAMPSTPLCEQQWELEGQCDRLLVSAIVAELPVRCLFVEDHLEGELREPCLDVTRRCRAIA